MTVGWEKDWMMCHSGRRVYPFDVRSEDVDILDIAHSLGMQCRYNGHVDRFYSVAEHCVHIADALMRDTGSPIIALRGLLHDAGEAYTGDFIRPVKNSLKEVGKPLKLAEDKNSKTIYEHFGLDDTWTDDEAFVKAYDCRIVADEKAALFGDNKPWDWDYEPLGVQIEGWLPGRAKAEYLGRFYDLSKKAAFQ